jgi:hypothetical protein
LQAPYRLPVAKTDPATRIFPVATRGPVGAHQQAGRATHVPLAGRSRGQQWSLTTQHPGHQLCSELVPPLEPQPCGSGPGRRGPPAGQVPTTHAVAVLAGLWDCHGHLLGTRTLDLGRLPLEPVALRAARCAADLRAALDAGVTSVREVGGLGVHLAQAVAEGTVEGPTIYPAGAVLSVTSGHGDLHSLPLPWMAEFAGWGGGELCLAMGRTAASAPPASSCAMAPG